MTLSDKATAFLAQNPTVIGVAAGVTYYEHPTRGDTAPLYYINDEGKLKQSDFYEMDPDMEEGPC